MTWMIRCRSDLRALGRQLWIVAGTLAAGIVIAAAVVVTLLVISPWLIAEYIDDVE